MQVAAAAAAGQTLQSLGAAVQLLGATVQRVLSDVQAVVDSRIVVWSDAFYKDYRETTSMVAARVRMIGDTMGSGCNEDDSDDVGGLELPEHELVMLDRLRAEDAATYAAVLVAAMEVHDADALVIGEVVSAALDRLVGPAAPA